MIRLLKSIGALLVIFACGWYGLSAAQRYASRPRQLRILSSALLMLETEIVYASTLLPEALRRVGELISPPISMLFRETGELLDGEEGLTASGAWERSLHYLENQTYLTTEDLEILHNFGVGLGISHREEQIKNLRLAREQLAHQEREADRERIKNERLWQTMGFLIGTTVVLVLI